MKTYLCIFLGKSVQCSYQCTKVALKQNRNTKKHCKGKVERQYGVEEKTSIRKLKSLDLHSTTH